MSAKHTPGPWTASRGAYGAIWVGPAQLPHPGKDSLYLDDRLSQREADARIIQAAPAALDVLTDLVAAWDNFNENGPAPLDDIVARARSLLVDARAV